MFRRSTRRDEHFLLAKKFEILTRNEFIARRRVEYGKIFSTKFGILKRVLGQENAVGPYLWDFFFFFFLATSPSDLGSFGAGHCHSGAVCGPFSVGQQISSSKMLKFSHSTHVRILPPGAEQHCATRASRTPLNRPRSPGSGDVATFGKNFPVSDFHAVKLVKRVKIWSQKRVGGKKRNPKTALFGRFAAIFGLFRAVKPNLT